MSAPTYIRSALLCEDSEGTDVFHCGIKVGRIEQGFFIPAKSYNQHAFMVAYDDIRRAAEIMADANRPPRA